MSKIKVLIVDDSVFMRKALEVMLGAESDIEIVGSAKNGQEAVDMAASLSPDIITMDVEMPVMDGITALQKIMANKPIPTLMVSSLTKEGADATLKALDAGALDFITKDSHSFGGEQVEKELLNKIRQFAHTNMVFKRLATKGAATAGFQIKSSFPAAASHSGTKRVEVAKTGHKRVVAIGTSTGGPQALQKVIPFIPENIGVPIVLTQHMPPNFTASLAQRLNALSKIKVIEAQGGEKLEPNVCYIAKGGLHLKFRQQGSDVYTYLEETPTNYYNIPAVDVMVDSIVKIFGKDCLGVIMTGMGSDGMNSFKALHDMGGIVIAQDEPSCVVYGMPRAVVDAGASSEIIPLDDIASRISFHV